MPCSLFQTVHFNNQGAKEIRQEQAFSFFYQTSQTSHFLNICPLDSFTAGIIEYRQTKFQSTFSWGATTSAAAKRSTSLEEILKMAD